MHRGTQAGLVSRVIIVHSKNLSPPSIAIVMPSIAAVLLLALPWLNPFSVGPTPAIPTLLFAWVCVAMFLQLCAIPGAVGGRRLAPVAVSAWLVAALLSALIGMCQYFGFSGSLNTVPGLNAIASALQSLGVSGGLDSLINSTTVGEAFGNLRQRNHFATLTNIGLAAVLYCTVRLGAANGISTARQYTLHLLCLVAAVLLAAANAASSSRTGLMQWVLLTGMAGIWAFQGRRSAGQGGVWVRNVLVVAGLGYVVAAASFPWLASLDPDAIGILARLHENTPACAGRRILWSNVLHLIAQKPWFGWGWGELGYAHFITLYPGDRFCDILDNAHNLPLHLAVELGIPVALVFCGACLWAIGVTKPWRETDPARQLAWSVLAVIGLHSLLEYPLWYGPFQIAVGLSLCLLYMTSSREASPDVHAVSIPGATVMAVLGVLILAGCSYAVRDYWRVSQIYTAPAERAEAYKVDTLEKIRDTMLFQNQVRFAEMGTTPLTAQNAEHSFELAKDLLHFSAEPQVAQRIVESAMMLGRNEDAQYYLQRFEAAFPQAHARWTQANSASEPP